MPHAFFNKKMALLTVNGTETTVLFLRKVNNYLIDGIDRYSSVKTKVLKKCKV